MIQSLFKQYVEKWFHKIVGKVTETFNGENTEKPYLYMSMLNEEYSPNMTWQSNSINHSVVAADVVSLGSSLPLKKRDSLERKVGKLSKLGIKFRKDEEDITVINPMIKTGTPESEVVRKIFDDAPKSIKGVHARNEIIFLQGFSTGAALVDTDTNDGTGIRVDYGYKTANTFHATTAAWSSASATPIDDIRQLFDKANEDGTTLGHLWMSETAFNRLRNSTQGRQYAARYLNVVFTESTTLPVPKRATMVEAMEEEFGAKIHTINSSIRVEKPDGTFTTLKPFAENNVIATVSDKVGRLVYGTLAEETNRVNGVDYEKSGSYILVKKFSTTDPLYEFTAAEAICLPVIDGANEIYMLHTDSTGPLTVDPTTLSFTKAANTTGKKVKVHSDNPWTAAVPGTDTWVTLTTSGDEITVKVSANSASSAPERTSTLTVTDTVTSDTATVTITQAANS